MLHTSYFLLLPVVCFGASIPNDEDELLASYIGHYLNNQQASKDVNPAAPSPRSETALGRDATESTLPSTERQAANTTGSPPPAPPSPPATTPAPPAPAGTPARPPPPVPTPSNATIGPPPPVPTPTNASVQPPAAAAPARPPPSAAAPAPARPPPPAPVPQSPGVVVGNCTLGDLIFHVLFNRTAMDTGMFGVENSVGLVGSREDILNSLMNRIRNHTRQEIEACLDLYRIPPEPPVGSPASSAASHVIYHRPTHLGGLPTLPVPRPPSDNFVYGHGYTTYLNPFNIPQRVPEFMPHPYLRANSLQDLFFTVYRDFSQTMNLLFEHGTPAFWFGRPAVTRPPPRG